jgi:DNA-binding LacI/PurR family transcriptional regulator
MNITELSKKLGISVGTISKALNGYHGVSEKTKERVQQAAKEYGYHPSDSARSLRRKNTDRIGLLNPTMGMGEWEQRIVGEHFLRILGGVVGEAERNHKDLVLYTTQPMANPEIIERIARSREVEGLIVLGGQLYKDEIDIIRSTGIQFVLQGRQVEKNVSFVSPDMIQAGYIATTHLIAQGHTKIAYIGQSRDTNSDPLRRQGYQQALLEHGISYNPRLDVDSKFVEQGGALALQELLSHNEPFTAIVFYSDGIYFEALQEFRDLLLGNPAAPGIAAVGMDNIYRSRWSEPGLSSVHLPLEEMGARSVSILLELLNSPEETFIQEMLPVSLVTRGSSLCT